VTCDLKAMRKKLIIIFLLIATLAISYATPRSKYKSPNLVNSLDIPLRMQGWVSKNISKQLDLTDQRFNFVSDIFARLYSNAYRENLLFLILDAGNFHNPKVCFGTSGYKVKELPDTEFNANGHKFKAETVYFESSKDSYVVIYWICINKKQVNWTEQKLVQLWYSLFNKEKIGLMGRIDIATKEAKIPDAIKLAQGFISQISLQIPPEETEYLFGK